MNNIPFASRKQRGFSIIEALIAGLALSFGMLGITGMQIAMSRSADVAKQRTEATRLAQQKIEEFRAFQTTGTVTGITGYASLASSASVDNVAGYVTNTTFARTWTVANDAAGPGRKLVAVNVSWTDRAGVTETVNLTSVISTADHAAMGLLMASGGGSRPSSGGGGPGGRNPNVPYPALDIGGGRSTYQWPNTSLWYVFSNTDAGVLYRCTTQPTSATDLDASCVGVRGYVVAGYVSAEIPNNPAANTNIDTVLSPWLINACSVASPTNVGTASCFIGNLVVSSAINPLCPYIDASAVGDQLSELAFYKCYAAIVELQNSNGPGWGGKLTFAAAPSGTRNICRFGHNLVNSSGLYVNIERSLNNENYFARMDDFSRHQDCASGQARHQP